MLWKEWFNLSSNEFCFLYLKENPVPCLEVIAMIQTEADQLVSLVNQKGEITSKEAAKILDIKERQVQEWADFLEQRGILNLKMNLFNFKLKALK